MKGARLAWADRISLSRIPLALLFLVLFRARPDALLGACIGIAIIAQLSDHLDGYLARRSTLSRPTGWLFDGIGDRAFDVAALLAFDREYGLSDVLLWLFLVREMCVYAFWIGLGDFLTRWPGYRKAALFHGGLVRLAIVLGCVIPYQILPTAIQQHSPYALNSLLVLATAHGYLCLFLLIRGRART